MTKALNTIEACVEKIESRSKGQADPVTTLRKAAQKLRMEEITRQLLKDRTNTNTETAKMSNTEKMTECIL